MDDTGFVQEIKQQPAALREVIAFYNQPSGRSLLSTVAQVAAARRKIIFTGMGTSLYAPYLIHRELLELSPQIEIVDAGELLHFGYGDTLVAQPMTLFDYMYFSSTVYSTLGFGDIVPVGEIRALTGIEAVSGLVLITWSASFTFLEMQRHWGRG